MIETITLLMTSLTFLWVGSVALIILMAIFLENELEGWATTLFSVALGLTFLTYWHDIFNYVSTTPLNVVLGLLGYVVLGIVWSILKWAFYNRNVFRKFSDIKATFIEKNGPITDNNIKGFADKIYFSDFTGENILSSKTIEEVVEKISPKAKYKKGLIVSWISYWPVSFIATILNDPFRRFFEWVYENVYTVYEKITQSYKTSALK